MKESTPSLRLVSCGCFLAATFLDASHAHGRFAVLRNVSSLCCCCSTCRTNMSPR